MPSRPAATAAWSRNGYAGLVVAAGGEATFDEGRIAGTVPDANLGGGVGAFVDSAEAASALTLTASTLTDNAVRRAVALSGDGAVTLAANTLAGGPADRTVWPTGTAVFGASTSAAGLWIEDNDLIDSAGAGVFLDGGTATLIRNRYANNAVDIIQQLCAPDTEPPDGPRGRTRRHHRDLPPPRPPRRGRWASRPPTKASSCDAPVETPPDPGHPVVLPMSLGRSAIGGAPANAPVGHR